MEKNPRITSVIQKDPFLTLYQCVTPASVSYIMRGGSYRACFTCGLANSPEMVTRTCLAELFGSSIPGARLLVECDGGKCWFLVALNDVFPWEEL